MASSINPLVEKSPLPLWEPISLTFKTPVTPDTSPYAAPTLPFPIRKDIVNHDSAASPRAGINGDQPSETELRQASMNSNGNGDRLANEIASKTEVPTLSSLASIKGRQRQSRAFAVPPTSRKTCSTPKKTLKRSWCISGMSKNEGTSSVNIGPTNQDARVPSSAAPVPRRSNRVNKAKNKQPPAKSKPLRVQAKRPKPSKAKTSRQTSKKPASAPRPPVESDEEDRSTGETIRLLFFPANEKLGVMPVMWRDCKTPIQFFTVAKIAWGLSGEDWESAGVPALQVTIPDLQWPLVIPWGSQRVWQRMTEALAAAVYDNDAVYLNVEVRCISTARPA